MTNLYVIPSMFFVMGDFTKLNCNNNVCYLGVFLYKSRENVPVPKKMSAILRCPLREVSLY